MIEREHIENHFITNVAWRELFTSKFPNWTPETWVENAWSIFEDNGYTYEIIRYSNNPKSNLYTAVKEINLYNGPIEDDDFIIGLGDVNISSALEQLLICIVCDFEVDVRTLK